MVNVTRMVRRTIAGFAGLWRRDRLAAELDAELGAYFESAVDEHLRAGLSREDAIRAARRELGSTAAVRDRVHDVGWESVAESVWLDARYGARGLVRAAGFTTTVILTLSLAIGVTTAIFSLLDAILLKPLPVRDPDRLVLVGGAQYPARCGACHRGDGNRCGADPVAPGVERGPAGSLAGRVTAKARQKGESDMSGESQSSSLVQGTLHMLVLKTLALEPLHGHGIGVRLEQISRGVFRVNAGSLFPALRRLERDGLIKGAWRVTENNRQAKYYALTAAGRAELKRGTREWEVQTTAIARILKASVGEL